MLELPNYLIVGGGLSGISAALWMAAQGKGKRVLLVEKSDALLPWVSEKDTGHQLLGSRSGFWPGCCTRGTEAGERLLSTWPGSSTYEWLESLGMLLETDSAGAFHARSGRDLRDHLATSLEENGIKVVTNYMVETIVHSSSGFRVWSKDGMPFEGTRLLLATGGERNHGLTLSRELGQPVNPVHPGYLRLRLASPKLGERLGPMDRTVSLLCEKTGEATTGEVRLSGRGLEGPALSALSAKAGDTWHALSCHINLKVDWLPETSGSGVRAELSSRSVHGGRRQVGETPLFGFTAKQWGSFLKAARIDPETPWSRLKSKKLQTLVQRLKADLIRFKGMGLPSGERAWAGGLDPAGIDTATGQSISVPGLYFAGEMLDILGLPGGTHYNLAWASAYVAGSSIGLADS